jgi:hypothetical protein
MNRRLVILIATVAASAGGYLAIRGLRTPQPQSASSPAAGRPSDSAPGAAAASVAGSSASPALAAAPEPAIAQGDAVNLSAPEIGGHVELVTSEYDREDRAAIHLIDRGRPEESSWMATAAAPQEIVFGFFEQQPARISSIVIDPNTHTAARWAKDVEVWTSMESPTSGFLKAASLTLAREDREQTVTLAPVEAKFVKIRVVSQYLGDSEVGIGKIRVMGTLTGRAPQIAVASAPAPPLPAAIEASSVSGDSCSAGPPIAPPPVHRGSAKVLVLARKQTLYPPLGYSAKDAGENPATSIYGRIAFTRVPPGAASPALLGSAQGFDTVVLAQVCDAATVLPDSFKRALVDWVGQGHKLIIHDSDLCDGANTPDYSFLPYRFATSNPGKRGAESKTLLFSEENSLGRSLERDPAFLDLGGWANALNELGDSNTVKSYDPHWCGHLVTRNVLKVNGFVETYAHYGRGLFIYNGFDYDQAANPHYRRLVTNELAQPFDPDGLSCSARLSDFVLTSEAPPQPRYMGPSQTYRYPVTLLSNQGYKGAIRLTATIVPADPAVSATLDRDAIDLVDSSDVQLTVATSGAATRSERTIAVRGTDASGRSNVLCLRLGERTTGSLRVTADLARPARSTKNLEIILDLSGSMKLPLGKSTRIATARRVLRDVVAKIPDDFKVGLRVYGHRYGSRQKETCTDSELIVPIQKLNRNRLLSVIDSTQPRGETPLVYSVLQTAADLKAVGGGSVILITDGEESCHGDAAAAARELKASGVDVTLQILGFTLSGKQVEQQLTQFAQATGGRYYSAQDGETLGRALLMAAVDKMPFAVFDAAGRQVATGDTDGASIDLPPGEYRAVIRAADQELVAEHVTVTTRGESVLKIVIKNDRFELQR